MLKVLHEGSIRLKSFKILLEFTEDHIDENLIRIQALKQYFTLPINLKYVPAKRLPKILGKFTRKSTFLECLLAFHHHICENQKGCSYEE